MIETLIIFATLGIFAGLIAGMFGVGGGIITVPVLVACFMQFGFEEAIMIHMAVGTSLGCIVFTGMSSAYAHNKKNAVNYNFFKPIASGIIFGAFIGALFAVQLNGNFLKLIIGIFALLVAFQMITNKEIKLKPRKIINKEPYFVGSGIGFLSSILGIGGGIFSVPYLKASGLPMTSSVGTSAACGVPIAIFGALGYLATGLNNSLLPSFTLGYIYLPALIGISLTSIIAARYGAAIAHRVSEKILKRMMACMMFVISFYMVFS
jgi:uncharacterized membrane protein YfcA